jgi:poly(3-hydroxyalkanoate) depolymerase
VSAPSPDQQQIRFVEVDGVRLRTSVRGQGPPLLLITGLGASLDLAEPFERELTTLGVQAISFDAPGVGQSTAYRRPRRMRGVASTVEQLLDALGYDQVDLLGVSLGGVIAQQLAHQAPQRVRRLVLAATGPGLGGLPGSPRVLLTLATPRRYDQPDYYRRVAGRIYGGAARRDPDALLHGSVARFIERPSTWGYLGQLFAISGWTSLPWLGSLRQPTLVLAGDDDPIVPLVNGRILRGGARPPALVFSYYVIVTGRPVAVCHTAVRVAQPGVGTAAAGEWPGAWGGIRTRSAPGTIRNRIGGFSSIASPSTPTSTGWPDRTWKLVSVHSSQSAGRVGPEAGGCANLAASPGDCSRAATMPRVPASRRRRDPKPSGWLSS